MQAGSFGAASVSLGAKEPKRITQIFASDISCLIPIRMLVLHRTLTSNLVFSSGCQWKPLQNPGNHSGSQRVATITFDNRPAAWFAPGSRKRVRTRGANLSANLLPVRTQNAYQPCVPSCVLPVRNCAVAVHFK